LGKQRRIAMNASLCHARVCWIEFDEHGIAAEPISNETRGACAAERVEDGSWSSIVIAPAIWASDVGQPNVIWQPRFMSRFC
jgi:hypothetical protein